MKTKPFTQVWYFPGTNSEREVVNAYELAGFRAKPILIADLLSGKVKVQDCDSAHIAGGFSEKDSIRCGAISAAVAQDVLPLLKEHCIPTCFECNGFQIGIEGGCFGDGLALATNKCGTFVSQPTRHQLMPSNCVYTNDLYWEFLERGEKPILTFPSAHGGGQLVGSKLNQAKVVMTYVGRSPNGSLIAGITDELGIFFGHMDHWNRRYDNPAGQLILRNLKKHL